MMMYDNLEYAKRRLEQTVVLDINGSPIYVEEIKEDWSFKVLDLKTNKRKTMEVDKVTLDPPPLGFVNFSEHCYYFCRKPMRKDWRQGISKTNLFTKNSNDYVFPIGLTKTFVGEYPKYENVLDNINKGIVSSQAFCRDFAIYGEILLYRFDNVGHIVSNYPVLFDKTSYLQQSLDYEMSNAG